MVSFKILALHAPGVIVAILRSNMHLGLPVNLNGDLAHTGLLALVSAAALTRLLFGHRQAFQHVHDVLKQDQLV